MTTDGGGWLAIEDVGSPLGGTNEGCQWWWWWWRNSNGGCGEGLGFLIYFRKLNNKNLQIKFDLNRCPYGKYLLVEHGVE